MGAGRRFHTEGKIPNGLLARNLLNPFKQDYIYREHFGQFPSEPKRQVINGVELTSRILHQTDIGLRDVQGADFLYEIENEKFIIIQYKRVSDSLVVPIQIN